MSDANDTLHGLSYGCACGLDHR